MADPIRIISETQTCRDPRCDVMLQRVETLSRLIALVSGEVARYRDRYLAEHHPDELTCREVEE